jgi:hypothetical protein
MFAAALQCADERPTEINKQPSMARLTLIRQKMVAAAQSFHGPSEFDWLRMHIKAQEFGRAIHDTETSSIGHHVTQSRNKRTPVLQRGPDATRNLLKALHTQLLFPFNSSVAWSHMVAVSRAFPAFRVWSRCVMFGRSPGRGNVTAGLSITS